ncbi:MAG: phytoene/squalene synthase family protein [Kofleriaceae bacterium]
MIAPRPQPRAPAAFPRGTVVTAAPLARATIAHHSKSFALASRLLDAPTRDRTAVVYTYCRRADDAVDEPGSLDGELAALQRLRVELDELLAGRAPDPVLAAFAAIARDRAIPRCYPDELLAGMAMDVTGTEYRSIGELGLYCYRVAGVVGLMMCHVFGIRDAAALVPAARLGMAMQLTNICRDVAEDWQRGRLYLPDDLLARHGAGGLADELGRPLPRTALPALAGTVRELLDLAGEGYRASEPGIAALPWRPALAVRAASRVYSAIGTRILKTGCDVTAGRAVVPSAHKLALVARAMVRTFAGWPARAFAGPVHIPTRTIEASDVGL